MLGRDHSADSGSCIQVIDAATWFSALLDLFALKSGIAKNCIGQFRPVVPKLVQGNFTNYNYIGFTC